MSTTKQITPPLLLCICTAAQAHHSISAHYDSNDVREVTGTVESVRWVNPHIAVFFSAEDEQGEVVTWRAEGAPINTLERQGVSLSAVQPGDTITVIGLGSPARYGHSVGHWEGETLVIATSDIDYPYFDDRGTPMSADMRVTERYGLTTDHSRLAWTAAMQDPMTFTEPHSFGGSMAWAPEIQIREFACEPE